MIKMLTSIFLFSNVAFGQTNSNQLPEDSIATWKTFGNSTYSIQYPSTWELTQNGQMGTSFILLSSLESEKDKFRENVNLSIQSLTGLNIDLSKYTEISENQIITMVTNSTLLESKRIKNDNDEYHKLIYSGDQGIFHLQFEQYYWVINDNAFILTFTTEKEKFEDFQEIGEKILKSFILKK